MESVFKKLPISLNVLLAALPFISMNALAADLPVLPNAGSIFQQIKPSPPTSTSNKKPELDANTKNQTQAPPSMPFMVKSIQIQGNSLFDTPTLHALVASEEGKNLTLQQLDQTVSRITQYYQKNGFLLARAIIPPQTISSGVVVIQIIEASYGKILLNNTSNVHDPLLKATLSSLISGHPMESGELDKALLLLSDIPEVKVNAALKPGEKVGTTDLDVNTSYASMIFANVTADNYGNKYIGRARLIGNGLLVNPAHHGDILSGTVATTGEGMNYGRLSYDTIVTGKGTHIGGAYSSLIYKLVNNASALDAHGTANVASLWAKQTLARSKQFNIYGQIQYDSKLLKDHIDIGGIKNDRRLQNTILSFAGDFRDQFFAGGGSLWSVGVTSGHVDIKDLDTATADAASANTQGNFLKWNANFTKLQTLTDRDFLYASFTYQWANSNLDPAEKMSIGGPYTVRAYDMGAVSGDTGHQETIELRHNIGAFAQGRLQAIVFVDSAHVNISRHPWTATTANSATLTGAGIGANWSGPDMWSASLYLASRIGSQPSIVEDSSSARVWALLSKSF